MIDIAERLRLYARQFEDLHAPQNVTIGMREAADEIDRLRAALEEIVGLGAICASDIAAITLLKSRARAALEDKS